MYSYTILTISEDGDRATLKVNDEHQSTFHPASYANDSIHPILTAAENCNSHNQVLALLENIKSSEECQKYVHLYRKLDSKEQASRIGLFLQKIEVREAEIDELIEFVKERRDAALSAPCCGCYIL